LHGNSTRLILRAADRDLILEVTVRQRDAPAGAIVVG